MRNIGKIYGDAPAAPFCSGGVARFVLADPFFPRLGPAGGDVRAMAGTEAEDLASNRCDDLDWRDASRDGNLEAREREAAFSEVPARKLRHP